MKPSRAARWQVALGGATLVACGGGGPPVLLDSPDDAGDAASGTDVTPDARPDRGTRRAYVLGRLAVPTTAAAARTFGLDVDQAHGDPDDGIDNQLGLFLAGLGVVATDAAAATTRAIDRGEIIVLADLYFDRDLVTSERASLWLGGGSDPLPPACDGPGDVQCRRHLDGHGAFGRAGPAGEPLQGQLYDRHFRGRQGAFTLPLALGGGELVAVPITRAHADLTNLGDFVGFGRLGGAVTMDDVAHVLVPGLAARMVAAQALECPPPRELPACGCLGDTVAAEWLAAADADRDCILDEDEGRALLLAAARPDLDLDGDGTGDALSIGIGVSLVAGEFAEP